MNLNKIDYIGGNFMREIKSINDCQNIEEFKELQSQRYNNWYKKENNRKKRLEYYKEYYRKSKLQKALNK